jgi:hypothetical protein
MRAASPAADAVPRAADWLPAARTALLVALVLGLASSITLSQIALAALAAWLLVARWAGRLPAVHVPLLWPVYNFGDTEVLLVALTVMSLPFALARQRTPAGAGE